MLWSLLARAGALAPRRLLDAGCGTGRNLIEFASLGDGRGIDPSPEAVAFCRARGLRNVEQGTLEALPFPDASFGLVLACDVLEHVEDDGGALRELRRVAEPGGFLLATVPAYRWLWSQHDVSHHHIRRYTLRRLLAAAAAAGWRPVVSTYFNALLLPPIALVRALARRGAPRTRTDYELTSGLLNTALELPMRLEARAIRRGWRWPAGVSVGVVLRSP